MKGLLSKFWKKDEGFSLIELIIVIAILAIIAAIAVPNLIGNIRSANESTDESNAKLIYDSVNLAIGKDPGFEGINFGSQAFDGGANSGSPSSTNDDLLLYNAANEFPGRTIPTIRASTNGTSGDNFNIAITSGGVVEVYNNATPQVQLY